MSQEFPNDRVKEAYETVTDGLPNHETMDRLVSFLYILMRDHVTPGNATKIAMDACTGKGPYKLSNGYLAKFAEHLAHKLRTQKTLQEVEPPAEDTFVNSDNFRTRRKSDHSQE